MDERGPPPLRQRYGDAVLPFGQGTVVPGRPLVDPATAPATARPPGGCALLRRPRRRVTHRSTSRVAPAELDQVCSSTPPLAGSHHETAYRPDQGTGPRRLRFRPSARR